MSKEVVDKLKKDLLETGVLDQQKIEDAIKEAGVEKVEISEDAKEIKKLKSKVNSIFDKHLNKK